jgi:hypothetical protein
MGGLFYRRVDWLDLPGGPEPPWILEMFYVSSPCKNWDNLVGIWDLGYPFE